MARSMRWLVLILEAFAISVAKKDGSGFLDDFTVLLQFDLRSLDDLDIQRPVEDNLKSLGPEARLNKAFQEEKRQSSDEPWRMLMANVEETEYVSSITVGGQKLMAIMDTGSYELVVFSTDCKSCGSAARYNTTDVRSRHQVGLANATQFYGSGDLYSREAYDNMGIGPFAPEKTNFWEATEANMPILRAATFQAIIGMGPPESTAAEAWDLLREAVESVETYYEDSQEAPKDVISTAVDDFFTAVRTSSEPALPPRFKRSTFSICLGARPLSDGYFVWQDTSHLTMPSVFTRVQVQGKHSWSVELRNVRMSGAALDGTNAFFMSGASTQDMLDCNGEQPCSALMDSGTSLLAMPREVIARIQDVVQRTGFDCRRQSLSDLPSLAFELDGRLFSLPPDAFMSEVDWPAGDQQNVPSYMQSVVRSHQLLSGNATGIKECNVVIMESYMDAETGPLWIFGMPFFRKYYTTFDIGKNHASRALYVAEATEDCRPAQSASFLRAHGGFKRRINITKVRPPPRLRNDRSKSQRGCESPSQKAEAVSLRTVVHGQRM